MASSRRVLLAVAMVLSVPCSAAGAQTSAAAPGDSAALFRGLAFEADGKYPEAVPHYLQALDSPVGVNALLGLERVYSELGSLDSVLPHAAAMIQRRPTEAVPRTIELRTLHTLGRTDAMRRAFDRWKRETPGDPTPYRDMSRLLIERGQLLAADSVIEQGRQALGSLQGLHVEVAQIRAAAGSWEGSASAWLEAMSRAPYLEQAAAYSLAPVPEGRRDSVRLILSGPPVVVAARLALAELESGWGSPEAGWEALRDLAPDSVVAAAWNEFAERAERSSRWSLARDALIRLVEWRPTAEMTLRAANASLRTGDAAAALRLAPLPGGRDSAQVARRYVLLHVRALGAIGRVGEAERLVTAFDRFLTPGERAQVARALAFGWARQGEMTRARLALSAGGAEQDSSEAAGWIALYSGDLEGARALLRTADEGGAELGFALGLISRMTASTDTALGVAFMAMARGDTLRAAAAFEAGAARHAAVASLLLAHAARLQLAAGDRAESERLWRMVADSHADSPEAAEAMLELARAQLQRGNAAAARVHLEELLVRWPQSALAPQARRELELARRAIPGG
jgi:tetratricopeptide (TPR) repeat protein